MADTAETLRQHIATLAQWRDDARARGDHRRAMFLQKKIAHYQRRLGQETFKREQA